MVIINAREACAKCTPKCIDSAMQKIHEAVNKGYTNCYIHNGDQRPPVSLICHLVGLGYNIRFTHCKHYDNWSIKATWADDACGKVFDDTFDSGEGRELPLEAFICRLKIS